MKMQELKIEVFGRVQGVRFRHFVKESADRFGIKGYVLNKEDGRVLVVGQGERENLELFLNSMQRGPLFARVEGISYFWKDVEKEYGNFIIALDKGMLEDQKLSFINLGKKVFGIKQRFPLHIAIIPDGNRRWAKEKGLKSFEGHKSVASVENIDRLFKAARKYGVNYFTFWAFSTENWNRSKEELDYLFDLLLKFSKEFRDYAVENKIRFRHFGRKDRLPKEVVKEFEKTEKATKDFRDFHFQICMDYGGRDEITRAVNKILKSGINEIKEGDVKNYLDTAEIPDPDLIIRTSGERRLSGLMPFQSTYAELYFTDVYFPDFGPEELNEAIEEYARRARRFGK